MEPRIAVPELGTLPFDGGQAAYYAPDLRENEARPTTLFLHGMCASGGLECPVFSGAAASGFVVCPDGNNPCTGGGFVWVSTPRRHAARIDAAMTALRARHGEAVGPGRAIIGYSLGAPAALVQVVGNPGLYSRLMIVNASVEPSIDQMKKAGVVRVALVSGDRDATAAKLRAAAVRLAKGGVDARYFALEATGHYFDGKSARRMAAPLEWLLAR